MTSPPSRHRRFIRHAAAVAAGALTLTVVSGVADAATKVAPKKAVATKAKAAKASPNAATITKATAVGTAFPTLTVIDLATAKPFDLATLNSVGKAQLVWFWAPT
jgi:hypothetical protein